MFSGDGVHSRFGGGPPGGVPAKCHSVCANASRHPPIGARVPVGAMRGYTHEGAAPALNARTLSRMGRLEAFLSLSSALALQRLSSCLFPSPWLERLRWKPSPRRVASIHCISNGTYSNIRNCRGSGKPHGRRVSGPSCPRSGAPGPDGAMLLRHSVVSMQLSGGVPTKSSAVEWPASLCMHGSNGVPRLPDAVFRDGSGYVTEE